jgi:uncharacterized protein YraI
MPKVKLAFLSLSLLVLACGLSAPSVSVTQPTSKKANPATLTSPSKVCQVKTGIQEGTLNMRTCGGTYCPSVIVLREGARLIEIETQVVDGWLSVKTADGLVGWVSSKYVICEEE